MKSISTKTTTWKVIILITLLTSLFSCNTKKDLKTADRGYTVAAYIWPSCHDDKRLGHEILWPEGTGEWEVIKKGNPRFDGHYQPKVPLWGYEADDDPEVMERWIDLATGHGVNVFIFDWYWFDNGPFLESPLNNGFLKAKNNQKMDFCVMWANHDVRRNYWNVHRYGEDTSMLWRGAVDRENFNIVVKRVINQYFKQPNYFRINNEPVFSIFSLPNLIKGLGGIDKTLEALNYFREETKKAGFPGLHIQLVLHGRPRESVLKEIDLLGVNSITHYNWGGPHPEDYIQWGTEAMERLKLWDEALKIPFFPNASIGWDDTPRFPHKGKKDVVHHNQSPESFAAFLQKARNYCDEHPEQPRLITLYAWNEWVEGAYFLPDMKYGFGYIEAVKKVINGDYDKYPPSKGTRKN